MDKASQSLSSYEYVAKLLDIHKNHQDSPHEVLMENYSMKKGQSEDLSVLFAITERVSEKKKL